MSLHCSAAVLVLLSCKAPNSLKKSGLVVEAELAGFGLVCLTEDSSSRHRVRLGNCMRFVHFIAYLLKDLSNLTAAFPPLFLGIAN